MPVEGTVRQTPRSPGSDKGGTPLYEIDFGIANTNANWQLTRHRRHYKSEAVIRSKNLRYKRLFAGIHVVVVI